MTREARWADRALIDAGWVVEDWVSDGSSWKRGFAWLPTRLHDGRWIWMRAFMWRAVARWLSKRSDRSSLAFEVGVQRRLLDAGE